MANDLADQASLASPEELGALAEAYHELMSHCEKGKPATGADRIAKRVMDLLPQATTLAEYGALIETYWQVREWVARSDADQASWELAGALARTGGRADEDAGRWVETVLTQLTDEQLLELLKFPLSVYWMEKALLRTLGKRRQRTFADVWAASRWAAEQDALSPILSTRALLPAPR